MKTFRPRTIATLLSLFCASGAYAQQPQSAPVVPKLVRFSSSFRPADRTLAQTTESVTLSVYRDQVGGVALWHEIQNVVVDADGRYSVLMGATQSDGMPLDLFTSGEPRWLGMQFNRPGEAEQPRVLLVSVPYALKAADADTLGGKPASAYLLAAPPVGADTAREPGVGAGATTTTATKPKAVPQNSGLPNYIGKFANTTDLVDSAIYEVNGNVGIFTTQPAISLDVRTGALPQMGIAGTTDYLTFFASDQYGPAIYWDPAKDMRFGKGGAGLYNPYGFVEQMRIQSSTGNVGVGTLTPRSKLDVSGDINLTGNIWSSGSPVLQFASNQNWAMGIGALQLNNTGTKNVALGGNTLQSNTSGQNNVAVGLGALAANTTHGQNVAIGESALQGSDGDYNTAVGWVALLQNGSHTANAAFGWAALGNLSNGDYNVALGPRAGAHLTSGSYNAYLSNLGVDGESNTIRIGDSHNQTFIAGIRNATTGFNDAVPVLIDSHGQLGVVSSSRRFKEDVQDMGNASHDLMRLRPVTFRYQKPFADGSKPIQYGLIAEEVAEVYPDLVAHSADGQIETVKYQVLDSMLLNEVQRQQTEFGAQKDQIRRLEQQNQSLQERLAKLEAALASISVR